MKKRKICVVTGTRAEYGLLYWLMKEIDIEVIGIEGEEEGSWVLVDVGDIIVHIMTPPTRAYYNLEELWSGN